MKRFTLNKFNNVCLRTGVALQQFSAKYRAGSREHAVMMSSAAITMGLLTVSSPVLADGWAGMAKKGAEQSVDIQASIAKALKVFGFFFVAGGIVMWWRKGKEGDNSQVKAGQIFWPIICGAALGAVGFIMDRTGETIGISPSEYGRVN